METYYKSRIHVAVDGFVWRDCLEDGNAARMVVVDKLETYRITTHEQRAIKQMHFEFDGFVFLKACQESSRAQQKFEKEANRAVGAQNVVSKRIGLTGVNFQLFKRQKNVAGVRKPICGNRKNGDHIFEWNNVHVCDDIQSVKRVFTYGLAFVERGGEYS